MIKWFSYHYQLYFFPKKIQIEIFFAIKTFSFDTVYFVNFSVIKGTKWETGQSLLGAENLSQARRMREFWIRRTLASRALFQRRSAVRACDGPYGVRRPERQTGNQLGSPHVPLSHGPWEATRKLHAEKWHDRTRAVGRRLSEQFRRWRADRRQQGGQVGSSRWCRPWSQAVTGSGGALRVHLLESSEITSLLLPIPHLAWSLVSFGLWSKFLG